MNTSPTRRLVIRGTIAVALIAGGALGARRLRAELHVDAAPVLAADGHPLLYDEPLTVERVTQLAPVITAWDTANKAILALSFASYETSVHPVGKDPMTLRRDTDLWRAKLMLRVGGMRGALVGARLSAFEFQALQQRLTAAAGVSWVERRARIDAMPVDALEARLSPTERADVAFFRAHRAEIARLVPSIGR